MAHQAPHPNSNDRGGTRSDGENFRSYGGGATAQPTTRFNDMASWITETSSLTNPVELSSGVYDVDDDVSIFDSAVSALTGFTEHFACDGGFATSIIKNTTRKIGASSIGGSSGFGSEQISAITFDINGGSIEVGSEDNDDIYSKNQGHDAKRHPLTPISPQGGGGKAVQFLSPKSAGSGGSNKAKSKSMAHGDSSAELDPISSSSSVHSGGSNNSKKRAPVPPLRDPNMEDSEEDQMWEEECNYDINPTLLFLVMESRDWNEAIRLLDGKGLENKNDVWNLGQLFGRLRNGQLVSEELAKTRQLELRQQARTWIVRRERTGMLRWRMLPLHAALVFHAPFEVVLRLYHLYPGAIRCRNDQGMLPLHHCFLYASEDKILEFLLDVFPEALSVMDDKGRLPLGCTPKDGGENERRSNILVMFSNFQVEMAKKVEATTVGADAGATSSKSHQPQRTSKAEADVDNALIGAAPRYTSDTDFNQVLFNPTIIKPSRTKEKEDVTPTLKLQPITEEVDDSVYDRYATEESENICLNGRLSAIPEDCEIMSPKERASNLILKSELLALSEKNKRKGLKKLFGKKRP